MPRGHVVAAGCWLWATMTALFAMTTRLAVAMPICAVNGIGARKGYRVCNMRSLLACLSQLCTELAMMLVQIHQLEPLQAVVCCPF